jgi:hypothetical protein
MALVAVAAALARALPAGAVIIPRTLLTVTPNATLKSGAIVTVSGSGFDATPQTVYLAQCPAGV